MLLLLQELEHQQAVYTPVAEATKRLQQAIMDNKWQGFHTSLNEAVVHNRSSYVSGSRTLSSTPTPPISSASPEISSSIAIPATQKTVANAPPSVPSVSSTPALPAYPRTVATSSAPPQTGPLFEAPKSDQRLLKLLYGSPSSQPLAGTARSRRAAAAFAGNGTGEQTHSPRLTPRNTSHIFSTAYAFQSPPKDFSSSITTPAAPVAHNTVANNIAFGGEAVQSRPQTLQSGRWDGIAAYDSPTQPQPSNVDDLSSLLATMNRDFDMWQQQLQQVASDVQVDLHSLSSTRGYPRT